MAERKGDKVVYRSYGNPEAVGWQGWIESRNGRALAFVRLDGGVVWDW